jgi:hypothetical protein
MPFKIKGVFHWQSKLYVEVGSVRGQTGELEPLMFTYKMRRGSGNTPLGKTKTSSERRG